MNFKKILAGAAAVAALSFVAGTSVSAKINDDDAVMIKDYALEDEWGAHMNMRDMYADTVNVKTADITVKDDSFNGAVIIQKASDNWGWTQYDQAVDNGDGTWTVSVPCDFQATDDFIKINVRDWDGAVKSEVVKVTLKDADGNVLAEVGDTAAAPEAPAEEAAVEETVEEEVVEEVALEEPEFEPATEEAAPAAEEAPAVVEAAPAAVETTTSTNTGNASAAVAVTAMALAAAAMVASKRK